METKCGNCRNNVPIMETVTCGGTRPGHEFCFWCVAILSLQEYRRGKTTLFCPLGNCYKQRGFAAPFERSVLRLCEEETKHFVDLVDDLDRETPRNDGADWSDRAPWGPFVERIINIIGTRLEFPDLDRTCPFCLEKAGSRLGSREMSCGSMRCSRVWCRQCRQPSHDEGVCVSWMTQYNGVPWYNRIRVANQVRCGTCGEHQGRNRREESVVSDNIVCCGSRGDGKTCTGRTCYLCGRGMNDLHSYVMHYAHEGRCMPVTVWDEDGQVMKYRGRLTAPTK